jgi:hypothetical protein
MYGPAPAGPSSDNRDGDFKAEKIKNGKGGGKQYKSNGIYGPAGGSSKIVLRKRKERFVHSMDPSSDFPDRLEGDDDPTSSSKNNSRKASTQIKELYDPEKLMVIGVCQTFEKEYLRLTAAPDPSTVRPETILKEYMNVLIARWISGNIHDTIRTKAVAVAASKGLLDGGEIDVDEEAYLYICSQLKAIRQDLTVQHVVNNFTVDVYEKHARIALESGDFNEYNQCQTQLKQFYHEFGLTGCEEEFVAYRILYYVQLLSNRKYSVGSSDLLHTMQVRLSTSPSVAHAQEVREAVQTQNWWRLLKKLYPRTPNQGKHLLDLMVPTWRLRYLQQMCRAYRPHIPVTTVLDCLGYDLRTSQEQEQGGWDDGVRFLLKGGGSFLIGNGPSQISDELLFDKRGGLCIRPTQGLLLDTSLSAINSMNIDDLSALL